MTDPDDLLVKGVVRGGQIVLEAPLGVPDGMLVTITGYQLGDIPGEPWPDEPEKRAAALEIVKAWAEEARQRVRSAGHRRA
ncbi:MAG TPA: hypothetical protein VH092_01630 [Urbifossiella sp.]|jgi:hypothetical protein|nr:hypothetical protein [Urbifossiella sp.]